MKLWIPRLAFRQSYNKIKGKIVILYSTFIALLLKINSWLNVTRIKIIWLQWRSRHGKSWLLSPSIYIFSISQHWSKFLPIFALFNSFWTSFTSMWAILNPRPWHEVIIDFLVSNSDAVIIPDRLQILLTGSLKSHEMRTLGYTVFAVVYTVQPRSCMQKYVTGC